MPPPRAAAASASLGADCHLKIKRCPVQSPARWQAHGAFSSDNHAIRFVIFRPGLPSISRVTLIGRLTDTLGERRVHEFGMSDGVFLARIFERHESAARRLRIVQPSRWRRAGSSRQAMTWARDMRRDSSGLMMLVNRMKSRILFSYTRRVPRLVMLANHSTSGGTSASR
jgi:hypothetical protein